MFHRVYFLGCPHSSKRLALTYLCPSLPVEHRPSTTPRHRTLVLGCSGHSRPVDPLLFQLCFSVSPPTVARPAFLPLPLRNRLVGLEVRRPPRERKIPGSNPACAGIFSGSSHTSDSKIGTSVDTLPGAWRYRVSARTSRPGVSIL